MKSRVGVDDAAHLVHFQSECGFFEWLLHHAALELAEVAAFLVRRAVRVFAGELRELGSVFDLLQVAFEDLARFLFRSGDVLFAPARWPSRARMLDE